MNDMQLIFGAAELNERLDEYLYSREWWVIPDTDADECWKFLEEFEERFYSGDANDDYQILCGGIPLKLGRGLGEIVVWAVAFGHKRRCSPEQLSEFLAERALPLTPQRDFSPEGLRKHDILWLTGPPYHEN